jgi:PAS domain-containing protein
MTSVCLTALKKVEDELRESECRYRAVVEQAAEGIVLFDVDSKRALEANVACQNLLGYTPEAILRLTSYQFSEVLIASPKPPWLHLSGAKVVSKGPAACTETLSLSAYSAYLCGM